MGRFLLSLVILTLAIQALAVDSSEVQAASIIRYGEEQLRGDSTQATLVMVIRKPDFTRKLRLRSWTTGDKRALVEILEPVKEEGISSLRSDDQMWNYLPKTDQVVRVPTSLMLQSWMGSDFTNDDLMKSSSLIRDYNHRVLKNSIIGKEKVVLIECVPKPNAPVVWGKIHYWARTVDRLPLKQEFYDEKGKWVRTMSFAGFKKMDNRVIPTLISVKVAENPKQKTTILYQKVLFDRAIDENLFSPDLIRRAVQDGKSLASGWSQTYLPGHSAGVTVVRTAPKKVAAVRPVPKVVVRQKNKVQTAGFYFPSKR